jgi:hypothetical protein
LRNGIPCRAALEAKGTQLLDLVDASTLAGIARRRPGRVWQARERISAAELAVEIDNITVPPPLPLKSSRLRADGTSTSASLRHARSG